MLVPTTTASRTPTDRWRRLLTLTVVAVALAGGCAGATEAGPVGAPSGGPASVPAETTTTSTGRSPGCDTDPAAVVTRAAHERIDTDVAGVDRWYTRFVPTGYAGRPVPLVVDLHGYLSGSAVQSVISGMGPLAEDQGFVVVTPQGSSDMPYWNAVPHADLPDDVGFVAQVIDEVSDDVCIDPARVYVDGFSNGAFLASLLACRMPGRVAAIATVAGLQMPADCPPGRSVPVLAIHGTADEFASFHGRPNPGLDRLTWNTQSRAAFEGLPFAPVEEAAARWAARDGCPVEPTRTRTSASVQTTEYRGCRDGATVRLHTVEGAGHTWPNSAFSAASEAILGPSTSEIDASQLIWAFFRDHPMS